MRKLGIILPIIAGFTAVPAYAQDLGVSARAEIRVGYDEPRANVTVLNEQITGDFGVSGNGIGVEAGVDARITETILVGAYAGMDFSKADGCVSNPFRTVNSDRRDETCLDAGRNLTAGLRLGLPLAGGLIYGKGGYSRGKFEGSFSTAGTSKTAPLVEVFSEKDTVSGYHLGGGFELDFGRNFYGKGEYVHTRYKDAFVDELKALIPSGSTTIASDRFDPHRHQLMIGFGMRFGGRR